MKPAAVLSMLALFLAACGGGGGGDSGSAPVTVVDETRTYTGGFGPGGGGASSGNAIEREINDGPRFTTPTAGRVTVCTTVTWTQQMLKSAPGLRVQHTPLGPVNGAYGTASYSGAGVAGANVIAFERCEEYGSMMAGNRTVQTRLEVWTDCRCSDALGTYSATVRWVVKVG